jgi:hypothetical protein
VFVKRYGAFGESGIEMFSRTTDGGEHWSLPLPIFVPPPLTLTDPTLINVLLDGTLLNFVLVANLSPFLPEPVPRVPWFIMATRSRDQGLTWSLPAVIAEISPGAPVADGEIVRAYNLISTAVDLVDGTAYVAWNEIGPMSSSIRLSRSSDGGATWSAPEVVRDGTAQAFIPSVAVSGDGTVAVTYDDFRNDSSGDDGVTTDIWFSYLPKNGTEWKEIHLAGPFDTLTAPETESSGVAGLFVGDYQGLVGLPGGDFAAIFAQAEPQATAGPSDVFFARIHTDTTD